MISKLISITALCVSVSTHGTALDSKRLNVYTVASEYTDGLHRLLRSGKLFGYDIKVLGLIGDKMQNFGNKINILAKELKILCADKDKAEELFMFVDAYDVVLIAPASDIVQSFEKLNANIVFSAEVNSYPDSSLASQYPAVGLNEYRYLCSGGIIGYTKSICDMILPRVPAVDTVRHDQLLFTKIFLDSKLRTDLGIVLDTRAEIFQNLQGAMTEISVQYMGSHSYVYNAKTGSHPKVLHGNGRPKSDFDRLTDYVPDGFSILGGCKQCEEETISLANIAPEKMPLILLGIFIDVPTPFLAQMLELIWNLNYPKKRIAVLFRNAIPYHQPNVTKFLATVDTGKYLQFTMIDAKIKVGPGHARNLAIGACQRFKCDFAFLVDSLARITNPDTLKLLIEQNRNIIAPFLKRPDTPWTNFWSAVTSKGSFKRSDDFTDIVGGTKRGLWNVPVIANAMLIRAERFKTFTDAWVSKDTNPDFAFSGLMHYNGHFKYVTNMHHFGHLVNPDNYNTSRIHPELWEIESNRVEWEEAYIDPDRFKVGAKFENGSIEHQSKYEVCPDVYTFPLVTPLFCDHLVDVMEHFGKWSDGSLSGGYENVPTVDIHMHQVGFADKYMYLLKTYVSPLAAYAFDGFQPKWKPQFSVVARYQPDEKYSHLLPHPSFNLSTFSTTIALRRIGIDFEGGGTRFVGYNCSYLTQKQGWVLMHPGRLTHRHEDRPVTKGMRYVALSFSDSPISDA